MSPDRYRYFRIEARELADGLSNGLLELERGDGDSAEIMARLMRLAHTLKGAARVVRLPHIASTAHEFENLLSPYRDNVTRPPTACVSELLALVDAMNDQLASIDSPSPSTTRTQEKGSDEKGPEEKRQEGASGVRGEGKSAVVESKGRLKEGSREGSRERSKDGREREEHGSKVDRPPAPQAGDAGATTKKEVRDPQAIEVGNANTQRASSVGLESTRVLLSDLDQVLDALFEAEVQVGYLRDVAEKLRELRWHTSRALAEKRSSGLFQPRLGSTESSRADLMETRHTVDSVWAELSAGLDAVTSELSFVRSRANRLRLVPVSQIFGRLERASRDAAASTNRLVALRTEGGDIELDAQVLAYVRDALIHVIRNAVDHGIEPPDVRRKLGKEETGHLTIRAERVDGHIRFSVIDDGAGFDFGALQQAAKEAGQAVPDETDAESLTELAFQPGLSTRREVSTLSGRGVGLDVVRRTADHLRGEVALRSQPGKGSIISMTVPVSLSTVPGLMVLAAGEAVALPLEAVRHCYLVPPDAFLGTRERGLVALDGRTVPLLALSSLLRPLGSPEQTESKQRPSTRAPARNKGVSASQFTEDGERTPTAPSQPSSNRGGTARHLASQSSMTRRSPTGSSNQRPTAIPTSSEPSRDNHPARRSRPGQHSKRPTPLKGRKLSTVLLMGSEAHPFALLVERIIGVRPLTLRRLPSRLSGLPVTGVAFDQEGTPQPLLDPYQLKTFAGTAAPTGIPRTSPPPPLLVIDDSITTRMLERSILETAGYEVDTAASGEEALGMAHARRYGLFVVDVDMPGMDGFEFVARTRADPSLQDIPSLIVSSRDSEGDRRRGCEVGARAYIVKSHFVQDELLDLVKELVQ